ncbi:MAG: hypothetical protein ACO1SX_00240 [Actinomycetota bacterium]
MTRSIRRFPTLAVLAALVLTCGLAERCSALILLTDVTPEKANELGITVRSRTRENDVWVQMEFKTTGPMKNFKWADLEVKQGGKHLVTVPILPRKPANDSPEESKQLAFYIDPAALPNAAVTVVVYDAPLTGTGYRFKMKDFLPSSASRKPAQTASSGRRR